MLRPEGLAQIKFLVKGIHLYPRDVATIEIPLPPLEDQRRMVDILNRANGIRRLRREALDKARQLIPALFMDMFGDPATNPMGWPIKLLGELGDLDRGRSQHRPRNDPRLLGGPYPFIQTGMLLTLAVRSPRTAQPTRSLG